MDPRTPVIVGAGQVLQREAEPERAREPLALMESAARRAADDAGAPALLEQIDWIHTPQGLWRYADPGRLLAERFGASRVRTAMAPISGSTVQFLVSRASLEIQSGACDVALVVGGEAERTSRRARRAGTELAWTEQPEGKPDRFFGTDGYELGWWERRYHIRPIQAFSMYENAVRAQRGETLDAHRQRIAGIWARNAAVASTNPYAWIQDGPSRDDIAAVAPDNPMVGYPYTKRMVANMVVDLGAALLLCSVETARRLGVPEDRWVFPHAATDAFRTAGVPERLAYHDEPVMRLAGQRAFELASSTPDDMAQVDLYSCFPSAVQIAAAELGFDEGRPLTVTGGLTFAGGPFNSYVLHALATLVDRLREDPGSRGFVSSVGGYMSKHAFGIYGTEPPPAGFAHACLDEEAEALPKRKGLEQYDGEVAVETYAVIPDGEGARLLFSCLDDAGARAFGTSGDPTLLAAVEHEELCGRRGVLRDGELLLG